ncbi:MAG: TlpA family protein disulfide reductase [Planctomycetaceae bacterium]|jgi:thiol-disulfide isomerase/thioredoxin|nr:TlpA family protein disulfide reductase [Planctomycetaceae bacterium]
MKRFLILIIISIFCLFFTPMFLFAEANAKQRLEELQQIVDKNIGIVDKSMNLELLQDLGKKRLPKENVEAAQTVYEATEKILAEKNISEEFRIWTLKRKIFVLILLAYEEIPRYFPRLVAIIDELDGKKDFEILLREAEQHVLRIGSVLAVNPGVDRRVAIDLKSLADRMVLFAKENPGPQADILIEQLFSRISQIPQLNLRDKRIAIVAPIFIPYFIESNRKTVAQSLIADARRALLPGHPMLIAGFDLDGKPFNPALLKNKVVLIQFWGTWCSPCKEEIPDLIDLYEKYHSKGFEIIGINTAVKGDERAEKVKQFLAATTFGSKRKTIPWLVLHEGIAAAQNKNTVTKYYGINELPVLILIARNGTVLKLHPLPSTLDVEINTALNAIELTPEEQSMAETARQQQEAKIDQEIQEQLKLIEKK